MIPSMDSGKLKRYVTQDTATFIPNQPKKMKLDSNAKDDDFFFDDDKADELCSQVLDTFFSSKGRVSSVPLKNKSTPVVPSTSSQNSGNKFFRSLNESRIDTKKNGSVHSGFKNQKVPYIKSQASSSSSSKPPSVNGTGSNQLKSNHLNYRHSRCVPSVTQNSLPEYTAFVSEVDMTVFPDKSNSSLSNSNRRVLINSQASQKRLSRQERKMKYRSTMNSFKEKLTESQKTYLDTKPEEKQSDSNECPKMKVPPMDIAKFNSNWIEMNLPPNLRIVGTTLDFLNRYAN